MHVHSLLRAYARKPFSHLHGQFVDTLTQNRAAAGLSYSHGKIAKPAFQVQAALLEVKVKVSIRAALTLDMPVREEITAMVAAMATVAIEVVSVVVIGRSRMKVVIFK